MVQTNFAFVACQIINSLSGDEFGNWTSGNRIRTVRFLLQ